ncbi:uncharacterized protein (DUF1697 family) [Novosphingobium chloroacetimidivorans]|uniref:Uncharacterized protein (DUF1697 family) n=1 Tax=Novosphingobium chloroacetimidivorans TaxID=1428314 RepID=A0A7W7K9H4_9SPHN|nr:DUF1697 domain-containing protein [Novosphingobium chloroacetimidivorans]MBB4858189.1 uncharacterized protein (DUF1697 family) [Novosphingobium chloroacetimidivorans]
MTRYVALFGSINVGGNRLKMADLRYAFEREEFEDVETVVASGNVLFSFDDRPTDGLEDLFAHMMRDRFDMKSFVAVRTAVEIRAAIEDNPFRIDGAENLVHTHFLAHQPSQAQFDTLLRDHAGRGPERLALGDRALFIDFEDGAGNTKLSGPFLAKRLGCDGTARNMRSLQRILDKMA